MNALVSCSYRGRATVNDIVSTIVHRLKLMFSTDVMINTVSQRWQELALA